jgi:hypothetical protein
MKFAATVFMCVVGATLLAQGQAQFGFGFGFPFAAFPMAPGGLFGRIFPPVIPRMRPGLFLRNGMAFFPFGGKRDLESQPAPQEPVDTQLKAMCSLSSLTSSLSCNGIETSTNFQCEIEPRGNVTRFKLVLADLIAERPVTREPIVSLPLLSRKSPSGKDKFTYISPVNRTHEIVSVFADKKAGPNGFFIKDRTCFEKFVQLVRDVSTEQLQISMFSSP